jgi:hypothetical protein
MSFNGTYIPMGGSVGSLYNAIIQSDISVDNNKKLWKMKIPYKTKNLVGTCIEE